MADIFFVGQTGDPNQVAAISLTTPIFMLFIAVGNIFGIGGSSLISRLLGRGEQEKAGQVSSFCFYSALVTGLAMIVLYLLFMDGILSIIGVNEKTVDFARTYLTYIAFGAPFIIIPPAFGHIVRAEGAPREAMIGMMTGTIINIILDPIMILTLDMGVAGAAWATVIGNTIGSLYYIRFLTGKKTMLSIKFASSGLGRPTIIELFGIGIPASLNNLLMSTSHILLNNVLNSYVGGEIYIAAMGVAMRGAILLILIQLGFAMGVQPLIGYNYGARNIERLKGIIRFSFICTVAIGTVLTTAYVLADQAIVRAFIDDQAVIENGIRMLRALILPGPVVGILFVVIHSLQAMGKIAGAFFLNVSRQGFIFIPLLFIFNATIGFDGVIYCQAIADYTAIIMSIIIFTFVMKNMIKEENWQTYTELEKASG